MDFNHEPVRSNLGQIRLLQLCPEYPKKTPHWPLNGIFTRGQDSSDACYATPILKCTITFATLDDADLKYNALSYVWGPPEPSHEISLNGRRFKVRENLWHFLDVASRNPEAYKTLLWVDQICIDQSSNIERGQQVSLMGRIYTQASKVLIWLGSAAEESDYIMEKISQGYQTTKITGSLGQAVRRQLKRPNRDGNNTLLRFLARPYWRRLWVTQEVILATAIVILCGTKELQWDRFKRYIGETKRQMPVRQYYSARSALDRNLTRILVIVETRVSDLQRWKADMSLSDVLVRFCTGDCENPRDKVFGLLGLIPANQRIEVDYNLSVVQLVVQTLTAISSRDKRLEGVTMGLCAAVGIPLYPDSYESRHQFRIPLSPDSHKIYGVFLYKVVLNAVDVYELATWVFDDPRISKKMPTYEPQKTYHAEMRSMANDIWKWLEDGEIIKAWWKAIWYDENWNGGRRLDVHNVERKRILKMMIMSRPHSCTNRWYLTAEGSNDWTFKSLIARYW
jgi:hypothetical protein